MPVKLLWQPINIQQSPQRKPIGLELIGDDVSVKEPTTGRIKIYEAPDTSTTKGKTEQTNSRLIATFHGKFHRNQTQKKPDRVTFELEKQKGVIQPHNQEVLGFDPETIFGVDALVLTFMNREFCIYFPFLLDVSSEGRFIELQAVAEIDSDGSAKELTRSAVRSLTIVNTNDVETTTSSSSGNLKYKGETIGNIVSHHTQFLISGATRSSTATWPASIQAEIIPLPWTGPQKIPFKKYSSGDMKIVLLKNIADAMTPDSEYLGKNITGITNGNQIRSQVRKRIVDGLKNNLLRIFRDDAGFAGLDVLEETEAGAAQIVSTYKSAQTSGKPIVLPFWHFLITNDDNLSSVGLAEGLTAKVEITKGNKVYLSPFPDSIGSGNKEFKDPIKIRSAYFMDRLVGKGNYKSLNAFNDEVDILCKKMAITMAHEIAHSLGMMHDMKRTDSGPYIEDMGGPVFSIMSSSIDTESFALDIPFSNQVKRIWQQAFEVTPKFDDSYIKNKTWGTNWKTTDWGKRKSLFYEKHKETGITYPGLKSISEPPPFAKTPPNVQRGTYIPPS